MTEGRIGVYGGTFDPLHNGHWQVAKALVAAFRLDQMLFVPAFVPPHKREQEISAPYHRYAMIALATADEERMRVSAIELEAPSRPYTVETLARLQDAAPKVGLFFVMGADSFAEITMWREYQLLLSRYSIIVAMRPSYGRDVDPAAHLDPYLRLRVVDLRGSRHPIEKDLAEPRIFLTDYVAQDISATKVRETVAAGRVIDGMVPPSVAAYIAKYNLYKH